MAILQGAEMKGYRSFSKNTQGLAKPEVQVREAPPRVKELPTGMQILCPFCELPHPIQLGQDSPCGTTMKVTAIQTIFPARTAKKHGLKCMKCAQTGGEMIRFQGGFVHLADCTPGTKLLATPPPFSRWAALIYKFPRQIRPIIEKRTGFAKQVKEVNPDGVETGRVLGYFFFKQNQGA
jgi:hypothetical protein